MIVGGSQRLEGQDKNGTDFGNYQIPLSMYKNQNPKHLEAVDLKNVYAFDYLIPNNIHK
jgi:hypothetical protein